MRTSTNLVALAAVFAALTLAACGHRSDPRMCNLRVNSFAMSHALSYRTYVLLPANQRVPPTDLEFQEYAWYVHRALMARNLAPARTPNEAQLAIFMDYGVGAPRESLQTYNIPVWGQTGVSASRTSGTVSTYGSQSYVNASTTYTPQYGVTGYRTHVESQTIFPRFATFSAVDLVAYRTTGQSVEVWKTQITSTGMSDDLRAVFPLMVAGSFDLFAVGSPGQVVRTISEDSPLSVWIRPSPIPPGAGTARIP